MKPIPLALFAFTGLVNSKCRAFLPPHKVTCIKRTEFSSSNEGEDDDLSLDAFQKIKNAAQKANDFDGYALRDIIYQKWGACFDVDFNRVDAMGFKNVYLNIMPFRLGKRPFRHASEYDYLCHLQAVVEILQDYEQLDYVLYQISETKKKPRPGTSPLVAVPIRLDLSPQQVKSILG